MLSLYFEHLLIFQETSSIIIYGLINFFWLPMRSTRPWQIFIYGANNYATCGVLSPLWYC